MCPSGVAPKCMGRRVPLASDRVTLHLTRVRAGLHQAVLATDRADAPERPRIRDLDVVAPLAEALHRSRRHAFLDRHMAHTRLTWVERARERLRVVAGRVDRLLEVQVEVHMREER